MPEHQINQDTRLKDLWERRKKLTPDEFLEQPSQGGFYLPYLRLPV